MNAYETIEERGRRLFPGLTFDTALPQPWVDAYTSATGQNPCGRFVWVYLPHDCVGRPAPLFDDAAKECPARLIW